MGKIKTKGNHFCRKIQLPIKTLYQKKNLRKMLLNLKCGDQNLSIK